MNAAYKFFFFFTILFYAGACSYAGTGPLQKSTPVGQYLRDETGILTDGQRNEIEAVLSAHNKSGFGRICVLIVQALPPNTTIDQFAVKKINEEPRGSNEQLDRILLLVALGNHVIRIETSNAVSPVLTNEFCRTIIAGTIGPAFQKGDFHSGIRAGVEALIKKLGESSKIPSHRQE